MRRAEGEVLPAVARRQGLARLSGARGQTEARRQATHSASLAADPGLRSRCGVGRRARVRDRGRRGVPGRDRPRRPPSRSSASRESARRRSGTRRSGRPDRGAIVLEAGRVGGEALLRRTHRPLVAGRPERVAVLPGPQRHALDVALLRVEADRPPERRLVGTALLSLIRELAADREVVLAIDDVQWLDPPSPALPSSRSGD